MPDFVKPDWMPALPPINEGWTVLDACVFLKSLNEEGQVTHAIRYSEDLTAVEALGMINAAKVQLEQQLKEFWDQSGGE